MPGLSEWIKICDIYTIGYYSALKWKKKPYHLQQHRQTWRRRIFFIAFLYSQFHRIHLILCSYSYTTIPGGLKLSGNLSPLLFIQLIPPLLRYQILFLLFFICGPFWFFSLLFLSHLHLTHVLSPIYITVLIISYLQSTFFFLHNIK